MVGLWVKVGMMVIRRFVVCVCVGVYADEVSVCMCLLRFRVWVGELFLSGVCEASIVCVCVCVCVIGWVSGWVNACV